MTARNAGHPKQAVWYHQGMTAAEILCTVAAPGVEVVTDQTATGWETVIHGGRLDGERFASAGDPEQEHRRACLLARMSGWGRRRVRVRGEGERVRR